MELYYTRRRKKPYKKIVLISILIAIIAGIFFYYYKTNNTNQVIPVAVVDVHSTTNTSPEEVIEKVSLSFVGDLLMHGTQRKSGYNKETNSYDFSSFFNDVKKYFENKDFVIGSLETQIIKEENDSLYSGYPNFKNPPEYLEAIKKSGINTLVTSNNHAVDYGSDGLIKTIKWIEKFDFKYTGTYKSVVQREKNPILILEKNNMKLALMSYTQFTNGYSSKLVNYTNLEKIKSDIEYAKENEVDKIIVWLHFGTEYQRQPSGNQKLLVENIAKAGADIIIGSHPHVIQPFDILNVEGREVFIAYSLGNFISNQYWRYSTDGLILNMEIEKKDGITTVKDINYIPTAVIREYNGTETDGEKAIKISYEDGDYITYALSRNIIGSEDVTYKVVPVKQTINNYENGIDKNLTEKDYIRLKTTWEDTTGLIGDSKEYKLLEK